MWRWWPLAPEMALLEELLVTPGSKNGAGVYQRLINMMPPHKMYEAFLGSGAVLWLKRPAQLNIGIDIDRSIIAACGDGGREGFRFVCADAVGWLSDRAWGGSELVYCDPPYLGTARCSTRQIYRHEMMSEREHVDLLRVLWKINAMVMISGYPSELYDRELAGWRRVEYQAMTRGGLMPEVVWCNFPVPAELHDYSFLGEDFRERCRIARKIKRWTAKLATLPALERAAILDALRG